MSDERAHPTFPTCWWEVGLGNICCRDSSLFCPLAREPRPGDQPASESRAPAGLGPFQCSSLLVYDASANKLSGKILGPLAASVVSSLHSSSTCCAGARTNSRQVLEFLRTNISRPRLAVHNLDEMLATGQTSHNLPCVFSTLCQTGVLMIAHGSNTWATFCPPQGAAVVEIVRPCDWSGYNHSDISFLHPWMHVNAQSLHLSAQPSRGNTAKCRDPFTDVPDYTSGRHIIAFFVYPTFQVIISHIPGYFD